MLRHLGPVSLFSKVRHPTSWPGSENERTLIIYDCKILILTCKGVCDYFRSCSLQKDLPSGSVYINDPHPYFREVLNKEMVSEYISMKNTHIQKVT